MMLYASSEVKSSICMYNVWFTLKQKNYNNLLSTLHTNPDIFETKNSLSDNNQHQKKYKYNSQFTDHFKGRILYNYGLSIAICG